MKLTKNEIIGLIQYTSGEMKEDLIDVTEQDAESILNEYLKQLTLTDVVERSEQLVCDYKYHNRDITTNGECTKCESHKWR